MTLKTFKDWKEMFAISNLLAAAGTTLHNTFYNVSRESMKLFLKVWEEADRGGRWEKTLGHSLPCMFSSLPHLPAHLQHWMWEMEFWRVGFGPSPNLLKCKAKKVNVESKCKFWAGTCQVTWVTDQYELLLFGSDLSVYFFLTLLLTSWLLFLRIDTYMCM